MKRLIALLLAAALTLGAGCLAGALADETVTEIRDIEDLRAMAAAPKGRYRLMNDIDMGGVDWTPIPFAGELDGGGHGLYNMRVTQVGAETRETCDGNRKRYETTFAGLFSTLDRAKVHDLKLIGALVDVETDTHCFIALLAGYMIDCTISDCTVRGRVNMVSSGVMVGTGGVAGYGSGLFERCVVDVELVFEDRNFSRRCEQFMGGVLSCGIADIRACMVEIDGYDSCHGYVHDGGLVGMYYRCDFDYQPTAVDDNIIEGVIHFFEDNPDRRAYCDPCLGELLGQRKPKMYGNFSEFKGDETKDFSKVLHPEQCDAPSYTETVIAPSDGVWGYTRHECSGCGYCWRDSYTPPNS